MARARLYRGYIIVTRPARLRFQLDVPGRLVIGKAAVQLLGLLAPLRAGRRLSSSRPGGEGARD